MDIINQEELYSISADHPAARKAALWVRNNRSVREFQTIIPLFEQEFDCEIILTDLGFSEKIIFNTEKARLWFLLQWS